MVLSLQRPGCTTKRACRRQDPVARPERKEGKLNFEALCERELDLEIAEALPHRDTLTAPPISIVVAPKIAVAAQSGVALALTVLSSNTITAASVMNSLHL